MDLNLPILNRLMACENLLIAGMGGGFDVFCGLPIYFELRARGKNVHLANYSFSPVNRLQKGVRLSDTLIGVNSEIGIPYPYFPEQHLVDWFSQVRGEEVIIWCFYKSGVRPLTENYATLIDYLKLDGILLIDGGVDGLMRGDEHEVGTLLEDTMSLIAVSKQTHVATRMVCCTGFGAERDVTYAHVFENIAELAKADAFLGSCSLVKTMRAYQEYEAALLYVQSRPMQEPSVINSSIVSAARGEFGDFHLTEKTYGSRLWISPLMPVYWFFELEAVARRNLFLNVLEDTEDFRDAWRDATLYRVKYARRNHTFIPLR